MKLMRDTDATVQQWLECHSKRVIHMNVPTYLHGYVMNKLLDCMCPFADTYSTFTEEKPF